MIHHPKTIRFLLLKSSYEIVILTTAAGEDIVITAPCLHSFVIGKHLPVIRIKLNKLTVITSSHISTTSFRDDVFSSIEEIYSPKMPALFIRISNLY